ncbi:MAG: twin-arginine translocation signal domain-containing protein [Gammaproteobacteria bacterium]|nr:twin-arginine translocation signal domain-containing protein [Gammaproteobacteria bacterium]
MKTPSRRQFLRNLGAAATAVPMLTIFEANADGVSSARLNEDDAAAKALGYRHSVADVDVTRYPRSKPVNGVQPNCANCVLFQARAEKEWGGCTIFPGKDVNAAGWCSAWAAKP